MTTRLASQSICLLASIAVLAALPSAASASAPTRLHLSTKADPAAPAGKPPKVVFTLFGTKKGQKYRVTAQQVSGQNPLNEQGYPVNCSNFSGGSVFERAKSSQLVLKPSFATYALGSNAPCRGAYRGKVELFRASGPSKVLLTFTLGMPSMRLTHVGPPKARSSATPR